MVATATFHKRRLRLIKATKHLAIQRPGWKAKPT
jgi:hypothetical protein